LKRCNVFAPFIPETWGCVHIVVSDKTGTLYTEVKTACSNYIV